MRDRRPVRGPVWITAYAVCVLVVLSFIAFEVLDVDGSDFLVTEPEQDLRRAAFQTPIPYPVLASLDAGFDARQVPRLIERPGAERPAHVTRSRHFRRTLPRSLLADPAPSV
jgi:hypothetical protein